MQSSNVTDKQTKMNFLQKLINHVEGKLKISIIAKPSKIVAGLEPEHTCHLLQLLIIAATMLSNPSMIDAGKNNLITSKVENNTKEDGLKNVSCISFVEQHQTNEMEDTVSIDKESKAGIPHILLQPKETKRDIGFVEENQSHTIKAQEKGKQHENYNENATSKEINAILKVPSHLEHDLKIQVSQCNSDSKATGDAIRKIVSKPSCSEKILSKPPFRFLHDLIMAVNKVTTTGLDKIYSPEEMVSSNVTDKKSKIDFLQKLITYVEGKLNISIEVKPSKIVVGLEPERTRYFLQLFSVVATMPASSSTEESQRYPKDITQNEKLDTVNSPENMFMSKVDGSLSRTVADKDECSLNDNGIIEVSIANSEMHERRANNTEQSKFSFSSEKNITQDEKMDTGIPMCLPEIDVMPNVDEVLSSMIVEQTDCTLNDNEVVEVSTANNKLHESSAEIVEQKEYEPNVHKIDRIQKENVDNREFYNDKISKEIIGSTQLEISQEKVKHNDTYTKDDNKIITSSEKEVINNFFANEEDSNTNNLYMKSNNLLESSETTQKISMRPTTARRRPPPIKERGNSRIAEILSVPITETPIIIEDSDERKEENWYATASENKRVVSNTSELTEKSVQGSTSIIRNILNEKCETNEIETDNTNEKEESQKGIRFQLSMKRKTSSSLLSSAGNSSNLETLGVSIQEIAHSAAPIGRCMGQFQLDLIKMKKEKEKWVKESSQMINVHNDVKTRISQALAPIQLKIIAVEKQITDTKEMIEKKKSNIILNEELIGNFWKRIGTVV